MDKKLFDKDATIDELIWQLQPMDQDTRNAKGKMSDKKDPLAQNFSHDLNLVESEYEQARSCRRTLHPRRG